MNVDKYKKNGDEAQVPPLSNRGVQNTQRGDLRACVDWLQATLTFFNDANLAFDILGVDKCKFKLQDRGLYGYKTHYKYGHISVLTDGGANMGVHIQMTGQGCREYEELEAKKWNELFRDIRDLRGKFARIDLAIDDITKENEKLYFTVDTLIRKIKTNCARSQFRKVKTMESIKIEGGQTEGQTLYIGKESSDIQLRFYDKAEERRAAGKELEDGITGWIRTEIQTRRKRADILADYIINDDNVGSTARGILKNYISFLIPSNDDNKGRWDVCKWWVDYLGAVDKLKLTQVAPDRTIERTKSWIYKQIAPSLGLLYMAYGGDDELSTIIADGVTRLDDKQMQMALDYKAKLENDLENDKERMEHLKKAAWQDYLFKSGAHRIGDKGDKIEKVTATDSDHNNDIYKV